jgi:hypothetical protein
MPSCSSISSEKIARLIGAAKAPTPAWLLYDAFRRWRRDASGETHNWPTSKVKS